MPDNDSERPSLEPPKLFGRRRSATRGTDSDDAGAGAVDGADDVAVFDDSGTDLPSDADATAAPTAVLASVPAASEAAPDVQATAVLPEQPEQPAQPSRTRVGLRVPRLPRRTPRERSGPVLTGPVAAAVSGAVAGLALVGFTWLGFRGCEAARGTSSCGTAPGMVALTVILVLAVVVGGFLLSRFEVPDPSATSFLGVGTTGVVCLLVLIDHLDHWSMVIVIPAVTALTFLGAWRLTTTYIDTD